MQSSLLCGFLVLLLANVALARPVGFREVEPRLQEHPARTVFEAKVRLADDEVLVVRALKRGPGQLLLLSDGIVSAHGMDASYRVVQESSDHRGTTLKFVGVNETMRASQSRTTATDTRLEMVFHDSATDERTIYAWFARVEKIADVQRRHPGYTPAKKPWLGAITTGSHYVVSWRPAADKVPADSLTGETARQSSNNTH